MDNRASVSDSDVASSKPDDLPLETDDVCSIVRKISSTFSVLSQLYTVKPPELLLVNDVDDGAVIDVQHTAWKPNPLYSNSDSRIERQAGTSIFHMLRNNALEFVQVLCKPDTSQNLEIGPPMSDTATTSALCPEARHANKKSLFKKKSDKKSKSSYKYKKKGRSPSPVELLVKCPNSEVHDSLLLNHSNILRDYSKEMSSLDAIETSIKTLQDKINTFDEFKAVNSELPATFAEFCKEIDQYFIINSRSCRNSDRSENSSNRSSICESPPGEESRHKSANQLLLVNEIRRPKRKKLPKNSKRKSWLGNKLEQGVKGLLFRDSYELNTPRPSSLLANNSRSLPNLSITDSEFYQLYLDVEQRLSNLPSPSSVGMVSDFSSSLSSLSRSASFHSDASFATFKSHCYSPTHSTYDNISSEVPSLSNIAHVASQVEVENTSSPNLDESNPSENPTIVVQEVTANASKNIDSDSENGDDKQELQNLEQTVDASGAHDESSGIVLSDSFVYEDNFENNNNIPKRRKKDDSVSSLDSLDIGQLFGSDVEEWIKGIFLGTLYEVDEDSRQVMEEKSLTSASTQPKPPDVPAERNYNRVSKSKSMICDDRKEDVPAPQPKPKNWPNLEHGVLRILREGTLNRTKITENGKRLRKNWSSCYVVLNDLYLMFFKDHKSFSAMKSATLKPEMCIDLSGMHIDRGDKFSNRKNVFIISPVLAMQILIQCDSSNGADEWLEAIQSAISNLPCQVDRCMRIPKMSKEHSKDDDADEGKKSRIGRSKSVKMKKEGSIEDLSLTSAERQTKIKAKLRKFFQRRPTVEALEKKGIYKDEPVFGCYLDCGNENPRVPYFVRHCIECIEKTEENMKTDGLYRASGNLSQVQKIRLQVDQHNWAVLDQEEDVHVLTGALKLYFRELKTPLIPTQYFNKAIKASTNHVRSAKISSFKDILKNLPSTNFDTLKFLLEHLRRVTNYQEFNRMHIPNLAIVFGPTLMRPEQESLNMAFDLMQQNLVIECLLMEFESIFAR
ncbi:WW domain-containing protein tag-325 isoform X5 [Nilaparvata lugens]|uniref:WW domain-containing protein tag-325 isoform X5 n=1 Tax=Nilaparvata lugens TaxID=108931 RepID=UPI00193D9791|nr:WW domain-containing protein tag-325 isoform X5 [Nilaparvata lugens]XP_039300728.1 WW domain-containing protein tag-325 isoform X5 [Nilaparvata lugens]